MPYLNMDDGFPEHRKVDALTDGAFRLHTSGLCYCARELTDGFILKGRVDRLMPGYKRSYLSELTAAAMWIPTRGGYDIHDYLEWNKPRAWWLEKRVADANRLAKWREKHKVPEGGNA